MGDINRQQGRGEMVPGTAAVHEKTQSREGKERPVERTLSSCLSRGGNTRDSRWHRCWRTPWPWPSHLAALVRSWTSIHRRVNGELSEHFSRSYTLPGALVYQMAGRGQDLKDGQEGRWTGGGEGGVAEGPAHLSLQVTPWSWSNSTVREGEGSWLFPGPLSCLGAPGSFFCPWDLSALSRGIGREGRIQPALLFSSKVEALWSSRSVGEGWEVWLSTLNSGGAEGHVPPAWPNYSLHGQHRAKWTQRWQPHIKRIPLDCNLSIVFSRFGKHLSPCVCCIKAEKMSNLMSD